ncbi:MAG: SWIM zinc finger family protein [Candidatus Obscuribacterales bacterium]|nr:SWIM zinc finger family protein [Candidatus Obscuribacterales bacterium]
MSVVGQKRSLTEYFDWNTLRKGKDYFDRGKVLRQWQEDDGAHCGEVSGSNGRSYKAILFLEGDGDSIFSAGCSCPVGKDCKHTAALLLSILTQMRSGKVDRKRAEEIRSLTIMGEQKQPALISADSLAPEVKASFRNLAQYLLGKKSIDATAFEKNKNRRNSIVYILGRTSYTRAPNISICSASILKNGSYGTMRNLSVDRVLGRGLSYAQPEDMEVAQLWTTITRGGSYYHYYTDTHIAKNVDPELFKVLMARVLATGRCFFESCNTKPLALGDEQSGSFAWQKDHGQWRLGFAVSGSDPSYVCLPWTVPYYVNETTGICGPVRFEGDPDMAVLDMVLAMRALTEDEARALPALLHPLGLMDLVPPPCCDLVVIKKIEALPSLCLEATTAANHFVVDERLVFQKGEVVRAARVSAHFPHPPAAPYIDENGVTVFEQQDTEGLSGFRNRLCDLGLIEVQPDLLGKHDSGDCYFIASDAAVWSDFDEEAVAGLRS